jgi:DNA invertase Pin-like site-specific DNA recombinase
MQQIDLPRYIHSLGWEEKQIILIDEDEGVSGAKRIDERKGMSRLYSLIITGSIGTVAVQAEDRLFRDETQIQVNVFIDNLNRTKMLEGLNYTCWNESFSSKVHS